MTRPGRRLTIALSAMLAGCASWHPLPLTSTPQLAPRVEALKGGQGLSGPLDESTVLRLVPLNNPALPALDPRPRLSIRDRMGAMAGDGSDTGPLAMASHARTEYGPGVDMRVDIPRMNLDDPGVGLRDRPHRVLTYSDLRTIGGALDSREPSRTIELHLTGNMKRYAWSFDGLKYSAATPIHFRKGERLRLRLVNATMMNHPIHLHGMWSEVEAPEGGFQVRKHSVNVQPAQQVSYAVTADNPGRWVEAGMFHEVVVS